MAWEYPGIGEFHRTRSHPDARQGTRSTAHRIAKDRNRDGDRSRRREQEASGSHIIHFRTSDQRWRCGVRKEAARGNHTGAYRMQGPRRRYGWRCNPIGYQPNYTHIPNEKAWSLREAELSDAADSETTKEAPPCKVCITSGSMFTRKRSATA